ncbi:MAG: hypothetical protein D6732_01370 [Methanobacteriota archaeon]|nr:MAG: hypothetical protein D6732_01370 [Euryarchaeota archaeon]
MQRKKSYLIFLVLIFLVVSPSSATILPNLQIKIDYKVGIFVSKDLLGSKISANIFKKYLGSATIIEFNDLPTALNSKLPLFIFSHGNSEGLLIDGTELSYSKLSSMVPTFRKNKIFLIACQSANIKAIDTKDLFDGFTDKIDATVAGLVASLIVAEKIGIFWDVFQIIKRLGERVTELINGDVPILLENTESGYEIAVKREHIEKKKWGTPYYVENVLWFNLDKTNCDLYFGLTSTLSGITSLVSSIAALGGSSVGIISVIAAVLFLYAKTVHLTSSQRDLKDCMAGVGGQLIPGGVSFWYDFGNDGGLNGKFFYTTAYGLGPLIYNKLKEIPEVWVPVHA